MGGNFCNDNASMFRRAMQRKLGRILSTGHDLHVLANFGEVQLRDFTRRTTCHIEFNIVPFDRTSDNIKIVMATS